MPLAAAAACKKRISTSIRRPSCLARPLALARSVWSADRHREKSSWREFEKSEKPGKKTVIRVPQQIRLGHGESKVGRPAQLTCLSEEAVLQQGPGERDAVRRLRNFRCTVECGSCAADQPALVQHKRQAQETRHWRGGRRRMPSPL